MHHRADSKREAARSRKIIKYERRNHLLYTLWWTVVAVICLGADNRHISLLSSSFMLFMLVSKVKHNIVYIRNELATVVTAYDKLAALKGYFDQVIWRLISCLKYIGLQQYNNLIEMLQKIQEINLEDKSQSKSWNVLAVAQESQFCGNMELQIPHPGVSNSLLNILLSQYT